MILYTDGLVERRDRSIEERLDDLCRNTRADEPETVCRELMHNMVGSDAIVDDIAVLVFRATRAG